jgi:hypothetical protein
MTTDRTRVGRALRVALVLAFVGALEATAARPQAAQAVVPGPLRIRVEFPPTPAGGTYSGRLLVFMKSGAGSDTVVLPDPIPDDNFWIVAKSVSGVAPGASITLGQDDAANPSSLALAPAGGYEIMAMLDVHDNFNYSGWSAGDLRSTVMSVAALDPAHAAPITLQLAAQPSTPPAPWPPNSELVELASPALSAFWGRPIHTRMLVVVPPGYAQSTSRYPVAYVTHGFGATLENFGGGLTSIPSTEMANGTMPPMIWVFLEQAIPSGTSEFLDSVNNGPWADALIKEIIPELERRYRMDARPSGRLLNGHSSGGWATAHLQIAYPDVFGGTWSTSPDPVDFHTFINVDLYSASTMYRDSTGGTTLLLRGVAPDLAPLSRFAQREIVLGDRGGQMSSFEWTFSPRGVDGQPIPLFNRSTGTIDRSVADYWTSHFDLSRTLTQHAATLAPKLRGKLHFIVGTEDTFFLDRPVHALQSAIKGLPYQAAFTYVDGKNHFNLYDDNLLGTIATQMYAVARPRSDWKPKPQ